MDPLTKSLLILAVGLLAGAGVCWAVMTIGRLREYAEQQRVRADQLDEARRQAERDQAQRLAERDRALEQLKAENDELRRTSWPGNLTLDQRAWASTISNLMEISASDQLDALQRLSPDAVRRVVNKIAPHLFHKEGLQ